MFCHINKILALSFYTFTACVPAVDCIPDGVPDALVCAATFNPAVANVSAAVGVPAIAGQC